MISDKEVWERIAKSFDKTRRKPWSKCIEFIDSMEKKGLFLDIGCGNGNRTIAVANYFNLELNNVYGIDINDKYIQNCRKYFNALKLDLEIANLPYDTNYFDLIVCNQVLEHLNSNYALTDKRF